MAELQKEVHSFCRDSSGDLEIHLVFKTHLDIGFTDFARNVVAGYYERFIPNAIRLARQLRESGSPDRFIWTVGSWLIHEILETGTTEQRKQLEQAIVDGDIVWHGLPFTTHTELMDASLFRHALSLSRTLDRRFGRKTTAAKMTDVVGHTRSIIPMLAEAGIEFLHIGCNQASTPPDVPPLFVWRHPDGSEVIASVMSGYGSLLIPDHSRFALSFAFTGDNDGPQTAEDVIKVYQQMREAYPRADVHASTLEAFAEQLNTIKPSLPVITQELGDTWIHGVGTDPTKVKLFREYSRRRKQWLEQNPSRDETEAIRRFSDTLILIPEHTWGMDEKTHLDDYEHYDREGLAFLRTTTKAANMEASWREQREYLTQARKELGHTRLGAELDAAVAKLTPTNPDMKQYRAISSSEEINIAGWEVRVCPKTGELRSAKHPQKQYAVADAEHALGMISYEIFSQADYDRFEKQFLQRLDEVGFWAIPDYTKPGIAPFVKEHQIFRPILDGLYLHKEKADTILQLLHMPAEAVSNFGAPAKLTAEIRFGEDGAIDYTLQLFEKPACRLPEAMWIGFNPPVAQPDQWMMAKMGSDVSPLDVVRNGNRHLHAVEKCHYRDSRETITVESLDAPLVAPGGPMLLSFVNDQPDLARGMYFNLFNNMWGTNFPMWHEDDMLFRFVLTR